MTFAYQREELHRLIDQLDEKWLGKAMGLLMRFTTKKRSPKKGHWNAIRTKVVSFSHLPKNWDGYGAIPVSREVADTCLRLLKTLPAPLLEKLKPEDLTPTPYSTITVDWEDEDGYFVSTEIGKDHANFYAELPDEKKIESENIPIQNDGSLTGLLKALKLLYPAPTSPI